MKLKNSMPTPYHMKMRDVSKTIDVPSDKYFNAPENFEDLKTMGYEPEPVDIFGGLVPEGKDLSNLKKNEAQIQERFSLNPQGGYKGR